MGTQRLRARGAECMGKTLRTGMGFVNTAERGTLVVLIAAIPKISSGKSGGAASREIVCVCGFGGGG